MFSGIVRLRGALDYLKWLRLPLWFDSDFEFDDCTHPNFYLFLLIVRYFSLNIYLKIACPNGAFKHVQTSQVQVLLPVQIQTGSSVQPW